MVEEKGFGFGNMYKILVGILEADLALEEVTREKKRAKARVFGNDLLTKGSRKEGTFILCFYFYMKE